IIPIKKISEFKIKDIVKEFTRQCLMILSKISEHEIIYSVINDKSPTDKCPNLKQFIDLFDKLSYVIKIEILIKSKNDDERKNVLIKFIKIAKKFKIIGNFLGLFAVVASLNNHSI